MHVEKRDVESDFMVKSADEILKELLKECNATMKEVKEILKERTVPGTNSFQHSSLLPMTTECSVQTIGSRQEPDVNQHSLKKKEESESTSRKTAVSRKEKRKESSIENAESRRQEEKGDEAKRKEENDGEEKIESRCRDSEVTSERRQGDCCSCKDRSTQVFIPQDIRIPPMCQAVCLATLRNPSRVKTQHLVVEPGVDGPQGLLVARILCKAGKYIPLRVTNVTEKDLVIQGKMVIANAYETDIEKPKKENCFAVRKISTHDTLTYLAEVTTPNLRGVLASASSVSVILGVLTQFLLGTFLHWRSVALLNCIIPIAACILLFFVPESPYWLVSKNKLTEAQKSIAWLRGWLQMEDVEKEFKEFYEKLKKTSPSHSDPTTSSLHQASKINQMKKNINLYCKKSFLWPFGLVSLVFLLGHFSGMTTLQTFAVNIFATLKAPIDKYYATIFLGIAEVLGCILSSILVHFVGKRKMNFFSLFGTGLCFFVVATYAYIIDVRMLQTTGLKVTEEIHLDDQTWLPLTFLIGAAFFSHTGIRILPWMLIGEVYYSDIRASATGFSGAISYVFGFTSNKIFFSMVSVLTLAGTFWLYSCVSLLGLILLYFWLPETEGKTLFQIIEHFTGGAPLDNEVSNFIKLRKIRRKEEKTDGVELGKANVAFEEDDKMNGRTIDIRL